MSRLQYHPLTVAEVVRETADAHSLRFEVPEALRATFAWKPGQHLQLHVPHGDRPLPRCYSISSIPEADEPLQVTVKRIDDGRASNWICDHVTAGDTLEVAPPAGVFTARTYDCDLLMFAGGSGITPVYSILRAAMRAGRGHVRLIYANRDAESVIFREALAELGREHAERLEIIHWLDAVQGFASEAQLTQLARGWERADCFVCGPGAFMDAAAAALHAMGVPRARVHIERFVSLPDDADEAAPAPVADGDAAPAEVEVHLDGAVQHCTAPRDGLLLDALEAAGIEAPHSCRGGACGACMCKLEEGSVDHQTNLALDDDDLEQGWILACQAVPTAAKLRIRYPE